MNEVTKVLCERRSIRKFKNEQIPRDILDEILKCGTFAPSGKNMQSAKIVVVQNKELIGEIAKVNGSFVNKPGLNPFYDAPTLIIVFADKFVSTYIEDGSAVISNIINAAFSLDVDSCWVHRAKETFLTEFGKELMKKWGLGDNYVGVGNVVLGYRDMILPPASPRKEDYIIFDNKDILLTICGYKDGDFNLNDYFDRIFKNIFEDKLIAVSGKEQCENCINYQNCEYSYKEE